MAKRFTDTEINKRAWYRKLPPRLKCAWDYLNRECDVVGIWHIDMDTLTHFVGEPVTLEELTSNFKVQIFEDDKIFIPGFVPFQYGDESGRLSQKNRFHVAVAAKLQARGFPRPEFKNADTVSIPMLMGVDTVSIVVGAPQGQGKDKDRTRIGKGKVEGGAGETTDSIPKKRPRKEYTPEFEADYKQYPRQEGKSEGYKTYLAEIKTEDDRAALLRAIGNYTEVCRRENREHKHIKHFGTFMNCWRDYTTLVFPAPPGAGLVRSCDSCTRGLIRAINRSSGVSEFTACTCEAGRAKSSYVRFDESKFERAAS